MPLPLGIPRVRAGPLQGGAAGGELPAAVDGIECCDGYAPRVQGVHAIRERQQSGLSEGFIIAIGTADEEKSLSMSGII